MKAIRNDQTLERSLTTEQLEAPIFAFPPASYDMRYRF